MIFQDPLFLLLLLLMVPYAYFLKKKRFSGSLRFSSKELTARLKPTPKLFLAENLWYARIAAIVLIVFALARPRAPLEETRVPAEGIDIVLAIDCSGSMLAEDFMAGNKRENRLEAVKSVVRDFINGRRDDRIGLVAFAARAYTVCPLTLDYDWLLTNLDRVKMGVIEDGTAVGSAISSSLGRLKDSSAKSKIIILLTDGINNAGKISPLEAAEAAKALGIKIYTIGAGSIGPVPYPVRDMWGRIFYENVEISLDEGTLKKIASETNGKYFRAADTESLQKIYNEIDAMEKTKIEEKNYREYKELFPVFLVPGLIMLMVEIFLANTILRRLP